MFNLINQYPGWSLVVTLFVLLVIDGGYIAIIYKRRKK